jgi:hypothetical protein
MVKRDLPIGRVGDLDAEDGQIPRLVLRQIKTQRGGIDVSVPRPSTSSGIPVFPAKDGRFSTRIRSALPLRHSARTWTSPPGASRTISVTGSCIGMMPVSSRTVATQIELEPDMGGVSSGSMMIHAACAAGFLGGTRRLTCRNTPPRGSFSTKFRNTWSCAIQVRWSQSVAPGGGATPPTITSPTSPSAWQDTTWITLLLRMGHLSAAGLRIFCI